MFYRKILLGMQPLCSAPCLVLQKTRLCGDEALFFLSKKRPSNQSLVLPCLCVRFSGFCVLQIGIGEKLHACPPLAMGPVCVKCWFYQSERYSVSFD